MEDGDAVGGARLDPEAGSPFEDHHDGLGEPTGSRRRTNSLHERSGGSRSIPPPTRRPRPNHVRRIDEKHDSSLIDPEAAQRHVDAQRPEPGAVRAATTSRRDRGGSGQETAA
jgi:hypothetical protein